MAAPTMAAPEAAPGCTKSPAANKSRLQSQLLFIKRGTQRFTAEKPSDLLLPCSRRRSLAQPGLASMFIHPPPAKLCLQVLSRTEIIWGNTSTISCILDLCTHPLRCSLFHAESQRVEVYPVTNLCGLRGVVGLRWRDDVSLASVCLQRFPTPIPACLYLSNYRVSVSHTLSAGCTKLADQTCAYTACREPPLENLASVSILASQGFVWSCATRTWCIQTHRIQPHAGTEEMATKGAQAVSEITGT